MDLRKVLFYSIMCINFISLFRLKQFKLRTLNDDIRNFMLIPLSPTLTTIPIMVCSRILNSSLSTELKTILKTSIHIGDHCEWEGKCEWSVCLFIERAREKERKCDSHLLYYYHRWAHLKSEKTKHIINYVIVVKRIAANTLIVHLYEHGGGHHQLEFSKCTSVLKWLTIMFYVNRAEWTHLCLCNMFIMHWMRSAYIRRRLCVYFGGDWMFQRWESKEWDCECEEKINDGTRRRLMDKWMEKDNDCVNVSEREREGGGHILSAERN